MNAVKIFESNKENIDLDQIIKTVKEYKGTKKLVDLHDGVIILNENLKQPLLPGTFVPTAEIASYFKQKEWDLDELLNQDKHTYSHIARARAICERNCPDEMNGFYSNLRQKLDSGEAKEWAKAAYEMFQKMDDPEEMTVIEQGVAKR